MYEFPCPHCQTPLRLRDQSLRGRTVDCPDCSLPVVIAENGDQLIGHPVPSVGNAAAKKHPRTAGPSQMPKWIAGSVAALLLIGLAIFVLTGEVSVNGKNADGEVATNEDVSQEDPADEPKVDDGAPVAVEDSPAAVRLVPENDPVAARLVRIHQLFDEYLKTNGQLPGMDGESSTGHFSWIAELNAWRNPGIRMDRDRPWSDPVNSSFVRRRFQEFENPAIPLAAGDDGYPPTHFVGIAGVGADAARLPADHPRAGIFGENRQADLKSIPDGASHTMLVAGVVKGHGSWARPGPATVRSFTAEPYIQGPDGFGSGHPDRMPVLMADGSVRELSRETDAVIVRRMAAMSDGLALDTSLPGDPLTMIPKPVEPPDPGPIIEETPENQPIVVELAPEGEPQIPIRRAEDLLKQKLAGYRQEQPVSFENLMWEFEELLAFSIDQSQLPSSIKEARVQLERQDCTLREVLDAVTREAGASYVIEPGKIVLLPASSDRQ